MKIEVGKVLKAQGIKGELKIGCYIDDSAMMKNVGQLYIGTKTYTVERMRFCGNVCYVQFAEITDRNAAESLQSWTVYADKEKLIVPNGRYFIDDVIGCKVMLDDGCFVGVVQDILQYGAADVYVCSSNGKTVSFPFLNDLVINVNTDCKSILLSAKRFGEVAVYDD